MSTTMMTSVATKVDEKSLFLEPYNDTTTQQSQQQEQLPMWNQPPQKRGYSTAFWITLNAVMTIMIVFMNKYTFQDRQMRKAQVLIAAWHFAATFAVLVLATYKRWRLFKPIRLPTLQVIPLSAFFAAFLLLNNLSLAHNPVGFYQFSKIMTTPTVVFLNYVLFRLTISRSKLLAVLLTCGGAMIATVTSLNSNAFGIAVACAAFTVTASYQIWIGKKIKDLHVGPAQLLLNQSATAVVLLLPIALCVDTIPDFSAVPRNTAISLLLGGVVASLINLSQFFIIGNSSALTFNIASQIKMLAILGLGWYAEQKQFSIVELSGIAFALSGAWIYLFWKDK